MNFLDRSRERNTKVMVQTLLMFFVMLALAHGMESDLGEELHLNGDLESSRRNLGFTNLCSSIQCLPHCRKIELGTGRCECWCEHQNEVFDNFPGVGEYGGFCLCPNGEQLQVGAIGNDCSKLACEGGMPFGCTKNRGYHSHKKGKCKTYPWKLQPYHTNSCVFGLNKRQCQEASRHMYKAMWVGRPLNSDKYPKGCFLDDEGVRYNSHAKGSGHGRSNPLCRDHRSCHVQLWGDELDNKESFYSSNYAEGGKSYQPYDFLKDPNEDDTQEDYYLDYGDGAQQYVNFGGAKTAAIFQLIGLGGLTQQDIPNPTTLASHFDLSQLVNYQSARVKGQNCYVTLIDGFKIDRCRLSSKDYSKAEFQECKNSLKRGISQYKVEIGKCRPIPGKRWKNLDFGYHKRTVEASEIHCQTRCENAPGCVGSEYYTNDGGCHLTNDYQFITDADSNVRAYDCQLKGCQVELFGGHLDDYKYYASINRQAQDSNNYRISDFLKNDYTDGHPDGVTSARIIGDGCEITFSDVQGINKCTLGAGEYPKEKFGNLCGDNVVSQYWTKVDGCQFNNGNCSDQATCTNIANKPTCICNPGYLGDGYFCRKSTKCDAGHGGCSLDATCSIKNEKVDCKCKDGFKGDGITCKSSPCSSARRGDCSEHATCTNSSDGSRAICDCVPPYKGDGYRCKIPDLCDVNNGGCGENVTCNDYNGRDVSCDCKPPFVGDAKHCELADKTALIPNLKPCDTLQCQSGCRKVQVGDYGECQCWCENQNEVLENFPGVGEWGGYCLCPNGQEMQVGAIGNDCSKLACEGGIPHSCMRFKGIHSHKKVRCKAQAFNLLPNGLNNCEFKLTENECMEAGNHMYKAAFVTKGRNWNTNYYPKGCFLRDQSIYFNKHPTGNGERYSHQLCKDRKFCSVQLWNRELDDTSRYWSANIMATPGYTYRPIDYNFKEYDLSLYRSARIMGPDCQVTFVDGYNIDRCVRGVGNYPNTEDATGFKLSCRRGLHGISGYRVQIGNCRQVPGIRWKNVDFGGHGRTVEVDALKCRERCERTPGCVGSDFTITDGSCQLTNDYEFIKDDLSNYVIAYECRTAANDSCHVELWGGELDDFKSYPSINTRAHDGKKYQVQDHYITYRSPVMYTTGMKAARIIGDGCKVRFYDAANSVRCTLLAGEYDSKSFSRFCDANVVTQYEVEFDACKSGNGNCSEHANCELDSNRKPQCTCKFGYEGNGYECTALAPCKRLPNGGCHKDATCTNNNGQAKCTCNRGYQKNAQGDCVDVCQYNHGYCSEFATCELNINMEAICTCKPGYEGNGGYCAPINPCSKRNGGCHWLATCTDNRDTTRNCVCRGGFVGDGISCAPIDPCTTTVCGENTYCKVSYNHRLQGRASCLCNEGYVLEGTSCVRETCPENTYSATGFTPCTPCTECEETGYKTTCAPAADATCWPEIDPCLKDNGGCGENATCERDNWRPKCTCKAGFSKNPGSDQCVSTCPSIMTTEKCAATPTCEWDVQNTQCVRGCHDSGEGASNGGYTTEEFCESMVSKGRCVCEYSNVWPVRACLKSCGCCPDLSDPCRNNGGCGENMVCENQLGEAQCNCKQGYQLGNDGTTCLRISTSPCQVDNGGCGENQWCDYDYRFAGVQCFCNRGFRVDFVNDEMICVPIKSEVIDSEPEPYFYGPEESEAEGLNSALGGERRLLSSSNDETFQNDSFDKIDTTPWKIMILGLCVMTFGTLAYSLSKPKSNDAVSLPQSIEYEI